MTTELSGTDTHAMVDTLTTTTAINVFDDMRAVLDDFTLYELGNMFSGLVHKCDEKRKTLHFVCLVDQIAGTKVRIRSKIGVAFRALKSYPQLMEALCGELKQDRQEVIDIITSKTYEHAVRYYITRVRLEVDPDKKLTNISYAFAV